METELTLNDFIVQIYCRALRPEQKDRKNRLSEVKLFINKLLPFLFRFADFKTTLQTMEKKDGKGPYAISAHKNYLQVACRIFTHATDQELVELFLKSHKPINEVDAAVKNIMADESIPLNTKSSILRSIVEPFHNQNKNNRSPLPSKADNRK